MSTDEAPAKRPPAIRVNMADLTLDQLDTIQGLIDAEKAGRFAATAWVALRGTDIRFSTLAKCKALTFRDVELYEDFEADPPLVEPS